MKLSRICKGNKAAGMRCYRALFSQYAYISGILRLTPHQRWWTVRHIILYTYAPLPFHQTSSLEGRWHVQSPGRSGRTPPLSAIGLLRPPPTTWSSSNTRRCAHCKPTITRLLGRPASLDFPARLFTWPKASFSSKDWKDFCPASAAPSNPTNSSPRCWLIFGNWPAPNRTAAPRNWPARCASASASSSTPGRSKRPCTPRQKRGFGVRHENQLHEPRGLD